MQKRQRNSRQPTRSARADRHRRRQRGDVSGDVEPRLCGGLGLQRPDRARRRRARRLRARPWRGARRHDGGVGAAQSGLQGSSPRIQFPCRRPKLDHARRRHIHRARRLRADCRVRAGLYFNPGPWRIPYHHRAILDYCKRLNVPLEPFIELNYNAFLHAPDAFGGRPQRIREIKADFQGHVSELLAKATAQGKLDEAVSTEDKEILLNALKAWGALDKDHAYKANLISARVRGYAKGPGGGLDGGGGTGRRRTDRALGHPQVRALAISAGLFPHRISDHDVPAGRRHGHDRQGVRARSRRSHPL